MRVPNADRAIIAPEKLRDYLLDPLHRRGGPKARLLAALRYDRERWQVLERDLREQHLPLDFAREGENEYGRRFEIVGPIATPCGRAVVFVSIWQIDHGTDVPRLITMFPR
jgi:hypothetical protein